METRSKASIRREQIWFSIKTVEFKSKIISLLEGTDAEVAYVIKKDLAIMTNMPFYKDRPEVLKITKTPIELIHEFARLFCKCEDKEFIIKLIKRLGANQGQTIRKAATRIGEKKDIWEHAIPTKLVVDEMIKMILQNDITDLKKLLKAYEQAGQRGVTKEQDKLLKEYRHHMPDGWDWRGENVDHLARYRKVGIQFH